MAAPFPDSFYCPITQEVMKDPVVDPEGNTYEREAIEEWLLQHHTSPMTRAPLSASQLVPNRALRGAIEGQIQAYKNANPEQPMPAAPPTLPPVLRPEAPAAAPPPPPPAAAPPVAVPVATGPPPKPDDVNLAVTATRARGEEVFVHASLQPGQGGATRAPVDICCVVDISGSMGAEAVIKTSTTGNARESHGLSLLDVVKHAVKTVVHSLQPNDRFALVTFSTTATTVFKLTPTNEANKKKINTKVEELQPDDTTNLWDGLRTGLDILQTGSHDRVSALLLLTDGLPNISPPRGEVAMLKRYKDTNKQLNTSINTFGFGYAIDTNLLVNLAQEGHGMHTFIPDASFVGTAFVNSMGNLLVTMAKNVTLAVEPKNGAKLLEVLGAYPSQPASWGTLLDLCSLQAGQTKDVVLRMSVPAAVPAGTPFVAVTARFDQLNAKERQERAAECAQTNTGGAELEVQRVRLSFVSALATVNQLVQGNKDKQAQAVLADVDELARRVDDPRTKALQEDITGQVREAITKTPENYFDRWGKHYLPSLARAHLLQQCNNFKDPGIQVYGGKLFQTVRDELDDIFCKLPPPKPSVRRTTTAPSSSSSYGGGAAPVSYARYAPISMSTYHNASGGCFTGEGMVRMADGTEKAVRDVVKGDKLATSIAGNTPSAEVVCVMKTHCVNGKEDLVVLPSGLRLTPYHPVRDNKTWRFPIDLVPLSRGVECEATYDFVLRGETHSVVIQGDEVVTLGHGIEGDAVASHPYFGTQRVVDDLKRMKGWKEGVVELFPAAVEGGKAMVRDKETGLICGFAPNVNDVTTARREP